MNPTHFAARVHHPDGPLVVERAETLSPSPGQVRVLVAASGICGADLATVRAHGADAPVTPGHEIAGTVEELGDGVRGWAPGDRVSIGWFGGSCGLCGLCRRGDVVHCAQRKIPGLSYPGGWAEQVLVPADALARIPDGLGFEEAASMGCAGVTTFNAVRKAGTPAGGRVAVLGLGGLGHLAVQWAEALGHETVAIARGPEREAAARRLGAKHYIDASEGDAAEELSALGGADHLISAASSTAPLTGLLKGLRVHGRLTVLGVDDGVIEVQAAQMMMNGYTLTGHLTGSPTDVEEAMAVALSQGVRPVLETVPLGEAAHAVERVRSGQARFRMVLTAGQDR